MGELRQLTSFSNKYSDNILGVDSLLNTTPTVSFVGDGTYDIDSYSDELDFSKHSKTFIYNSGNVDFSTGSSVAFNLGDALKYTTITGQQNLFQFSLYTILTEFDTVQLVTFKVNVFYGVTLLDTFEKEIDIRTLTLRKHYTFGFSYAVPTPSDVNFTFEISNGGFGVPEPNYILGFSGFKVEVDNRFLGIPTPYSLPVDYFKNPYSGWGYYVDSLATPTITIGTSYTQITIDGLGANITDYLPLEIRGVSELWSGSKITPISIGDDYDGRFDVTVTAKSGTPTLIELIIDISGATAGTNVAFTGYIQTGGTIPYKQSIDLDYFSLGTFLANGGRLYAKVDTGTITIGRRNIKITRKSKAF